MGQQGAGSVGAAPLPVQKGQQIDPVAWRQEVERLTPQLSRIKVGLLGEGGSVAGAPGAEQQ